MMAGKSQLELDYDRFEEPDRNHAHGGRSFYFFDLDDNVFTLPTKIILFHRTEGTEYGVSTKEYAEVNKKIGQDGTYRDYEIRLDAETGSYRRFRSHESFLEDIGLALRLPDFLWKGPSWTFFHHAVFNQRPLSLITARGHDPETLQAGMSLLRNLGALPRDPHYLGVYPVSNPGVRVTLGDTELKKSIPDLKHAAIIDSVEKSFELYGNNPYHRFGMSDDDPHNLELITDAMKVLKKKYPLNSFFVFSAEGDHLIRHEILTDGIEASPVVPESQLPLFQST